MFIAYLTSAVCLLGVSFYTIRASNDWDEIRVLKKAVHVAAILVWMSLVAAYWDVARQGDALLWRQWLVAIALMVLVALQGVLLAVDRKRVGF